jgi:hypothetical protein
MKHRYLIVGLFFFFLSMWLTVIAQAETDISVTGKSSGMGYEPGVGLGAKRNGTLLCREGKNIGWREVCLELYAV